MGIELNNDQLFASGKLDHWWHHETKQVIGVGGSAGTGKAQPIDTLIPTPNGCKKLGDLVVGDYVFNRHGKPIKVIGIFDQGMLDAYKVTFEDGRSTICNDEHLWTYITSKGNFKTRSLRELMDTNYKCIDERGRTVHKYRIPISEATQYSPKEFDIDPYVLGAFLGNGRLSITQLTLSSNDLYVVEEISKLIGATGYHRVSEKNYNYVFALPDDIRDTHTDSCKSCKYFQTSAFFRKYPQLCGCLARNKRIPEDYFYGSIEQRWSLIQGLFDTDGSIAHTDRSSVTYSSVSLGLLQDIKYILASLGYSSTIKAQNRLNNGKLLTCWELYIKSPNNDKWRFFRLPRKRQYAERISKNPCRRSYDSVLIYDIEKLDYKTEMRCIYVDDPEHLYLTNDFIVTHNTTMILYAIERMGLELDEVLFVSYMGKAVSRMIQSGLPAKTIHSTCYTYEKEIAVDDDGKIIIGTNGRPKMIWVPVLKDRLPKKVKLIVADEAYTIPEKNAKDLETFGVPIIAVGDPNQLEPPFGRPYFLANGPDIMLRQIMRQAEGNPIIYLAQKILAREPLKEGVYGTSSIIRKANLTDFALRNADIILTTTNRLRGSINNLFRESFYEFSDLEIPHIGEKVICRANDWARFINTCGGIYLTNGTTGTVDYVDKRSYTAKSVKLDFLPDYGKRPFRNLKVDLNRLNSPLGQQKDAQWTPPDMNVFEYGYALTTMSSQGSQWGNVVVLDEGVIFSVDKYYRGLYVAVTRATDAVTIVR